MQVSSEKKIVCVRVCVCVCVCMCVCVCLCVLGLSAHHVQPRSRLARESCQEQRSSCGSSADSLLNLWAGLGNEVVRRQRFDSEWLLDLRI